MKKGGGSLVQNEVNQRTVPCFTCEITSPGGRSDHELLL